MNHTTNLHLPQWEAEDRILRTDFNDAFQKLDAAVAANTAAIPIVKIKEVTLGADTPQWDIDMSDIDLSRYRKIILYPVINNYADSQCRMQINDLTTYRSNNANVSYAAEFYIDLNSGRMTEIELMRKGQRLQIVTTKFDNDGRIYRTSTVAYSGEDLFPLRSISIIPITAGYPLLSGSSICMYGLKA